MLAENGKNDIRDELPRVSVDTINEWQKIRSSLTEEMIAILEEKLKEHNMGEHRAALEQHMQYFLKRTLDIARPNLRVNGRNFDEFDEDEQETEQYDEKLDLEVHKLSDQRLKLDLEVAKKRRDIPMEVEGVVQDLLRTQREADERAPAARPIDMDEEMDDDAQDDDISAAQSAIEVSGALRQDLTEQLERAERLKQVEGEIRRLKT